MITERERRRGQVEEWSGIIWQQRLADSEQGRRLGVTTDFMQHKPVVQLCEWIIRSESPRAVYECQGSGPLAEPEFAQTKQTKGSWKTWRLLVDLREDRSGFAIGTRAIVRLTSRNRFATH